MPESQAVEALLSPPVLLIDRALGRSVAKDVVLVLGMAGLTGLAAQAQIRLWFTPVPITGQTFAFLLSGLVLGRTRGVLAQLVYVLAGAVGLPLFAGGSHGLAVLVGASGGYLIGGMLAAYLVGHLAERGYDRRLLPALGAMAVGEAAIYLAGLANLARFVPLHNLLVEGFWPFLPGDLLKMFLAAGALPFAWRLVGRRGVDRTPSPPSA